VGFIQNFKNISPLSLSAKIIRDLKTPYGLVFLLLAGIRLFFNAVIPLTDKTEARYGEIARLMAETGNFIVPQIDYGVPFWAKPPLSAWLSAGTVSLLGDSEFALRLPYWMAAILIAIMLSYYAYQKKINVLIPGIILFTLPEFFLHAGVISTDMMLSLCIAITLLSFWEFIHADKPRIFGLLFFVGIGLGLLAKGPIVGILSFPPLFIWSVWDKKYLKKIVQIPWFVGMVICLLIALPWYLLMETNSPGFIDYFIVGEHFLRFIDSSWSGDKYGFPKQQPLGIVWVFLLAGALPWSFVLLASIKEGFKKILRDPWQRFLLLWILWTPFFFTFSKSLIHTYTLPVMIPIALLITHNWPKYKRKKTILLIAVGLPVLMFGSYFFKPIQQLIFNSTDKELVLHPNVDASHLYALHSKSYSSQFYSRGKIQVISIDTLESLQRMTPPAFVIIKRSDLQKISPEVSSKLIPLQEQIKAGVYTFK